MLLPALLIAGCDVFTHRYAFASRDGIEIEAESGFGGGVAYFVRYGGASRVELFGQCALDCNERLAANGWAPQSPHYAFHVINSNRYRSKNRLLLFSFTAAAPQTLLDFHEQAIAHYRFTDSTLAYTTTAGEVRVVVLR